ncbi:hypothetical protein [Chryseobacterium sp. JV274]|uniref:hypothetical protein n=1 Tax=Chryseobacterium sp. JV274 TaxID=1932669 RepID=UPI00098534FE|nr:hypothetical protein [Chryseobacterium sp. JV274]
MKTSKDNFECQIKKQIEEREIIPSRDLWSEIEFQNSSNSRPKSQMNWVLVAACLVLTLSLGIVLFFLNQPSEIQPEIVKKAEENKADEIIKKPAQYNTPLAVQNNDKKEVKIIPPQDKEEVISAVTVGQNKLIPRETAVKKLDIPQISNPKLIAKADSLKTPVKKKKYVDPSTLLFSVEHKDVIEKTKDGSNVATTIDLNAR